METERGNREGRSLAKVIKEVEVRESSLREMRRTEGRERERGGRREGREGEREGGRLSHNPQSFIMFTPRQVDGSEGEGWREGRE